MPKRSDKVLTDAAVRRIKPPATGQVEHFDAALAGFAVRISATGAKSYVYNFRLNGRRRRLTIGKVGSVSLAAARDSAREALQSVGKGIDPANMEGALVPRRPDTFAYNVEEFIRLYVCDLKPKTQADYARAIRKILIPCWGNRLVGDIKRRDIIKLLDGMAAEGRPIAARRCYAVVRVFFNWCVDRDILEHTPAVVRSRSLPGKEVKREHTLTDDDIRAFWPACNVLGYPFGPMMRLLLVLGQRRSETATMKWPDIDLQARIWNLPSESTKAARAHIVPLPDLVVEVMESLPRFGGDYVFSTTEGRKPVSGFSKTKKRIDKNLEIAPWRIHDLRRSCATGLRRLGTSREVVGAVLNHAPQGVTAQVYDRYELLDEKRHALAAWGSHLEGLFRETPENVVPLRG